MSKKLLSLMLVVLVISLQIVAIVPTTVSAATQATYYVSPTGSDSYPGTLSQPFATITKARDTVRTINSNMTGDIYVYLRGGTYYTTSTIQFTASDSGTNGYHIIYSAYNGETPVIDGGTQVTGWTQYSGNIWKATLNRSTKLRSLYVNGVKAQMTQKSGIVPQSTYGTFTVTGTEVWAQTSGSTFAGLKFNSSDVGIYANPSDVELEWKWSWVNDICGVSNMTSDGSYTDVLMQQPFGAIAAVQRWGTLGLTSYGGMPYTYTIRNAFELLNTPGQFYFNKSTHTLYYYTNNENMTTANVIAPTAEGVITIAGTSTSIRVKNLQFYGITFQHDHYSLTNVGGSTGFVGMQSDDVYTKFRSDGDHSVSYFSIDDLPTSTIDIRNCDSLRVERCKFIQIGSPIALNLENDVINTTIIGNYFQDIAGASVNIGHPQHYTITNNTPDGNPRKFPVGVVGVCSNDLVTDNLVRNNGLDYPQCEGMTGYYGQYITESHNDIQNCPYGGIGFGWFWGLNSKIPPSTVPHDNIISNNKVGNDHTYLPEDGGEIYVMSNQPNSQITGNYLFNGPRSIYTDEGSGQWHITNNVCAPWSGSVWLNIWTPVTHDEVADNNYTNLNSLKNVGTNCTVTNTHYEASAPPWSSAAQSIINNAGLESTYQDLLSLLPVNLALNQTAIVSNYYQNNAAYNGAKAVDGNSGTRWATDSGTTSATLEIDFPSSTTFGRTVTKEYSGCYRTTAYKIQYWNGTSWVDASTGTSIGASKTDTFTPVTATKVRLNITSASDGPTITEFEVYNDSANLALNQTTVVSNYYQNNSTYNGAKAVDGDTSTRWATDSGVTAATLEVDFPSSTTIDRTVTQEGSGFYRTTAYTIQYWNGSAWVNASTGTTIGASKTDTFTPVSTTKVRLNITAASDGPTISEFQVFNN